jgi:hypothetical protein
MTDSPDSPDIPLELQRLRAPARGRSGNRRSELERLLDLTVLEPTHPELGSCWRFTGTTTPYGRIARCGVYAGWNPDQLKPVTHAENQSHMRKTHCKHGHPLSGDNLRISPNGVRACRACNAANQKAFRERQRRRSP